MNLEDSFILDAVVESIRNHRVDVFDHPVIRAYIDINHVCAGMVLYFMARAYEQQPDGIQSANFYYHKALYTFSVSGGKYSPKIFKHFARFLREHPEFDAEGMTYVLIVEMCLALGARFNLRKFIGPLRHRGALERLVARDFIDPNIRNHWMCSLISAYARLNLLLL